MFAVGDVVALLVPIEGESLPVGSDGVVVAVGSLMFTDSAWVDFGDVIVECDPVWLCDGPFV